jgi:hypothetical protein
MAGVRHLIAIALGLLCAGSREAFAVEPSGDSRLEACPDGRVAGEAPPGGTLQWCETPSPSGAWIKNGPWLAWYPSGKPKAQGEYASGKRHGRWLVWNPGGELISDREYAHGRLVKEDAPRSAPDAPRNEPEIAARASSAPLEGEPKSAPARVRPVLEAAPADAAPPTPPVRAESEGAQPALADPAPSEDVSEATPELVPLREAAPPTVIAKTRVSAPADQYDFLYSGVGPGEGKSVLGLGARALVLVPMFDIAYVRGLTDRLDFEARGSTIVIFDFADIGLRYRVLGGTTFSLAVRADATAFGSLIATAGPWFRSTLLIAGLTPGVMVSFGSETTQLTLGVDVPLMFLGSTSDIYRNADEASIFAHPPTPFGGFPTDTATRETSSSFAPFDRFNAALELAVSDSMHIYLSAQLYVLWGLHTSFPPFTTAIGAVW